MSDPEPEFEDVRPQTVRSPVESQDLNRPQGKCVERGKLIVLPHGESEPQGEPKGLWVWDRGGSEGRPVMGRIGAEPAGDIARRESGLTSAWCLISATRRALRWGQGPLGTSCLDFADIQKQASLAAKGEVVLVDSRRPPVIRFASRHDRTWPCRRLHWPVRASIAARQRSSGELGSCPPDQPQLTALASS